MDNKKNMIDQMDDLFKFILKNVDRSKTSNKNKTKIREEVKGLRSFVVRARPARIAVVGRRGAEKSSLINAIVGEDRAEVGDYKSQTGSGKWYVFENDLGGIDILDSRGLAEYHQPEEAGLTEDPDSEVERTISTKGPDVMWVLCKGGESAGERNEH